MLMQNRPAKDRRSDLRVKANLSCQFTFEGIVHDSYIMNLSMNGAFIWSSFIPPKGSRIVITLRTPLKNSLAMECEVVRTESALRSGISAFGVRFSHGSSDLSELIKALG